VSIGKAERTVWFGALSLFKLEMQIDIWRGDREGEGDKDGT
jgi:hypothetical protein